MNPQRKIAALSAQLRRLRERRRLLCNLIQEIERAALSGNCPSPLKTVIHGLELEGAAFLQRLNNGDHAGLPGPSLDNSPRHPRVRARFPVDKGFDD